VLLVCSAVVSPVTLDTGQISFLTPIGSIASKP
jgi:hypothetical protein